MPIQKTPQAQFPIKSAADVVPVVLAAEEVVFADLETTGFGQYHDITEIGAVKVHIPTGKILGTFSTFVKLKNQKKVPAKIVELTGITTEMLIDAPPLEKVLASFRKFLGNAVLSFHNATFDWTMLQQKYAIIGQQLTNEVVCTMKLFRYLHPGEQANLEAVTTYYGKTIEGHHRAYIDCKWSAACYRKMREELLARQKEQSEMQMQMPMTQAPAHIISYPELMAGCKVYRIQHWARGAASRIYCSTNLADFYWDVKQRVWNVSQKKTPHDLDVGALGKFILSKVGMDQAQFEAHYTSQ